MGQGVHAEVEITARSTCRVINASDETPSITSVLRSTRPDSGTVTVEFTADADADFEEVEEVFHYGDEVVYRLERETGSMPTCACEFVETHGCPVRHLETDDGVVVLSFIACDLDALRRTVVELRDEFDGVSLRRLTRSENADADDDLVLVDRAALTDRQHEVLARAHEMGYFDHPKGANATEVSGSLDINRSTFAEHLSAAQSKLLDCVLES